MVTVNEWRQTLINRFLEDICLFINISDHISGTLQWFVLVVPNFFGELSLRIANTHHPCCTVLIFLLLLFRWVEEQSADSWLLSIYTFNFISFNAGTNLLGSCMGLYVSSLVDEWLLLK